MTRILTALAAAMCFFIPSMAQLMVPVDVTVPETTPEETDSVLARVRHLMEFPPEITDTMIVITPLPKTAFLPAVFGTFQDYSSYDPFQSDVSENPAMRWLDRANAAARNESMLRQRYMIRFPQDVKYNVAWLPEAPKQYVATVNPKEHTIDIEEVLPVTPDKMEVTIKKRHWLRTFNASLQFSQAYVSPNWYQGGNNNLNMLGNIYYNVQLNKKYHPNLLFESTFQYKLGLNNAPDDSLRNYAISEDLLQINSTFGFKAAHRWYYSVTAQFKTQILNSYVKNTHSLHSAFLSPSDLNAGLGMTYNYANKKETFTFDSSISPLSFGMKTVIRPNSEINHEDYNVAPDRKCSFKFGSTAEAKLQWQMTKNIQLRSRVYVFTDYSILQADWENTLSMDINRYLSTQIYVHARYDTSTPRSEDPSWHKLQVKEILSFGLSYKFSTI